MRLINTLSIDRIPELFYGGSFSFLQLPNFFVAVSSVAALYLLFDFYFMLGETPFKNNILGEKTKMASSFEKIDNKDSCIN